MRSQLRATLPHGTCASMMVDVLRETAEYPNSFIPLAAGEERIETPRFTLCLSGSARAATVQRQRFAEDEIEEVLGEVRALLAERGRRRTQWEIGSAARPPSLVDSLLARGLVRDREPFAIAMALTRDPPAAPLAMVAERVTTYEDFVEASEIQFAAFASDPAETEERRAGLRDRWEAGPPMMHMVILSGEIICSGSCAPTPHGLALFGGGTLPGARGRGAYQALIEARWRDAVADGHPALLTQAGAMSRPILERLGFEAVGRVEMLVDEFD